MSQTNHKLFSPKYNENINQRIEFISLTFGDWSNITKQELYVTKPSIIFYGKNRETEVKAS